MNFFPFLTRIPLWRTLMFCFLLLCVKIGCGTIADEECLVDRDCPASKVCTLYQCMAPSESFSELHHEYNFTERWMDASHAEQRTAKDTQKVEKRSGPCLPHTLKYTLPSLNSNVISALAAHPIQDKLLIGFSSGNIKLWDNKKKLFVHTFSKVHRRPITHLGFSKDGTHFVSSAQEPTFKMWNFEKRTVVHNFSSQIGYVQHVIWSFQGDKLASTSSDKKVYIWTLPARSAHPNPAQILTLQEAPERLSFSKDGTSIWIRTVSGRVTNWEIKSGAKGVTLVDTIKGSDAMDASQKWLAVAYKGQIALYSQANPKQRILLKKYSKSIVALSFSPNGTWLASSDDQNNVFIWDLQNKKVRHTLPHMHPASAFSWGGNEAFLVSLSMYSIFQKWELQKGTQVSAFSGHREAISKLRFSQDGQFLLSASKHKASMWDARTGRWKSSVSVKIELSYSNGITLEPTRLHVAWTEGVRLFHVASLKTGSILHSHAYKVTSLQYLPKGRSVLTHICLLDIVRSLQAYSPQTGASLWKLSGLPVCPQELDVHPDEKIMAFSSESSIFVWDIVKNKKIHLWTDHNGKITHLRFSPDGNVLLSGSSSGELKAWNVASGTLIRSFLGHKASIRSFSFHPSGEYFASSSIDNSVQIWKLASGTRMHLIVGPKSDALTVAFHPTGKILAIGYASGQISVFQCKD